MSVSDGGSGAAKAEPGNDELVCRQLAGIRRIAYLCPHQRLPLKWYKDLEASSKGELLAAIDTPEVDQELSQAKASASRSRRRLELAKISADRWAKSAEDRPRFRSRKRTSRRAATSRRLPTCRQQTRTSPARTTRVVQRCIRSVFRGADAAHVDPGRSSIPSASDGQGAIRYRARRPDTRLRKCSQAYARR